jgi:cold shock CspA family protein
MANDREVLLVEIADLEREIARLQDEIRDGYSEVPEARRMDRESRRSWERHRYQGPGPTDCENNLRKHIAENRNKLDELRGAVNERKAQLRSLGRQANRDRHKPTQTARCDGIVKWFSPEKNYGFITMDIYVHGSAFPEAGRLQSGDRVAFDLVPTSRGVQAEQVRMVLEPDDDDDGW